MSRPAIEAAVAEHVGIPYKHNGRGKDGIDCLGLIVSFYCRLGIELPDGDGEPIAADWWKRDPGRYFRGLMAVGRPAEGKLRPLDLVYFALRGNIVTHGGVMVDSQRFIHVLERRSVMVTRLSGWWQSKLVGARRFV